jgi:hypothetical protein
MYVLGSLSMYIRNNMILILYEGLRIISCLLDIGVKDKGLGMYGWGDYIRAHMRVR